MFFFFSWSYTTFSCSFLKTLNCVHTHTHTLTHTCVRSTKVVFEFIPEGEFHNLLRTIRDYWKLRISISRTHHFGKVCHFSSYGATFPFSFNFDTNENMLTSFY
uniref:Uncharacterized protein n=1 Tax=Octopus bimaculoides TaxID=37653 RepID=A0A0L8IFY9_OCTBM